LRGEACPIDQNPSKFKPTHSGERTIHADFKVDSFARLSDFGSASSSRGQSNAPVFKRFGGFSRQGRRHDHGGISAGEFGPIHRHNAHAFVYVLEGAIVMQLRGGKEITLTPGQTFYEGPDDVHVVGRNASKTKPAKFIVFLGKDKGAPIVIPTK
jgi:quercetin dioxygenase-like cupin family protein